MENIFIPIEINHWRKETTTVFNKGFKTIDDCKAFFDGKRGCDRDYTSVEWYEDGYDGVRKNCDYDGAGVTHICKKISIE